MATIIEALLDKIIGIAGDAIVTGAKKRGAKWLFGHLAVPIVVLSYLGVGLGNGGAAISLEESVTAVPIRSSYAIAGRTESQEGIALIFEPSELDFALPWIKERGALVWTSLDRETLNNNKERLQFDDDGMRIRLPLLGVAEPFVIFAKARQSAALLLPGKKYSLADLRLVSKRSAALSMWSIIASMFGLGLMLNASSVELTVQDEARKIAAEEDEKKIVQG